MQWRVQPCDGDLKERFLSLIVFCLFIYSFFLLSAFLVFFLLNFFVIRVFFFHPHFSIRIFPSASAIRRYPVRVLQTPFRSVMEQIIFVLFTDTNCLIRNLKHRCSPRSVPRTAFSTSFDFRKKSFRSQCDATATSFPCNDISLEDNKKWTIVMFSFLIAQSLLIFFCRTRGFDLCELTIESSNYYLLPTIRRNYRIRSLQKVCKLARQTVACVGPAHRLCNLFQNRSNLYSSLL